MNPETIAAFGGLLISIGAFAKILFDSRRQARRLAEQLSERRDQRNERYGEVMLQRLGDELKRLDAKLEQCEQRHAEDQRRIAELEQGRMRREIQLAELSARIANVDNKVDTLQQTGIFAKFERGDFSRDE